MVLEAAYWQPGFLLKWQRCQGGISPWGHQAGGQIVRTQREGVKDASPRNPYTQKGEKE